MPLDYGWGPTLDQLNSYVNVFAYYGMLEACYILCVYAAQSVIY